MYDAMRFMIRMYDTIDSQQGGGRGWKKKVKSGEKVGRLLEDI